MTENTEAIDAPKEEFSGRLFRILSQRMRLPSGTTTVFERAERPPGVRILVTDGTRILLTKEWRAEIGGWDHRLPGGKVFDRREDYLACQTKPSSEMKRATCLAAVRELEEETSLRVPSESVKLLHHSVCGATVIWDLYYFLVNVPAVSISPASISTGEGERIRPEIHSYDEVMRLCLRGDIQEERTVAVLLRYLLGATQKAPEDGVD